MSTDQRKSSQSRFATSVTEEIAAPQLTAKPVPRKQTPLAMPAPPSPLPDEHVGRQSHDDIEHVLRVDQLERERAQLLVKLQDKEQDKQEIKLENDRLRKAAPTLVFPPESIPPAPPVPPPISSLPPLDIKALKKAVRGSPLGKAAAALGILLAIGWNGFNTYRTAVPEKRVDGLQARVSQNEQLSEKEVIERALERQRTLQALRAIECWAKQTRGGFQRQGLDLSSLPPGGIKALKLGDEDPNRPGPPRFIAEEKCPDFPSLPPERAPH